ncbi:MAG: heme lyase CcmF/NrfE family subunit [Desulfovibrionaceae bacterium]
MHLTAFLALVLSMLIALLLAGTAAWQGWSKRGAALALMENGHIVITGLLTFTSAILFWALGMHDFSFRYVHDYSDQFMPLFYTLTAFWAGQAGSLLFWAWATSLFVTVFLFTPAYRALSQETRTYFWLFSFTILAFFLLLMTNWSNPFIRIVPPPADGNGLNPLLQNPAMIFHPPLLFLGYAGFTVPGCLALAQAMSGELALARGESSWMAASRNFTLTSWLFLTAGIVLGGWWSYMELGWGGYWAWDPVENASLIPWLVASACIHTGVIESKRGCLHRTNVLLMALTLISCYFATYLVRSGVVDSLHAFGEGGVGKPLLIFILAATGTAVLLTVTSPRAQSREVSGLMNREGFLIMAAWLLMVLGLVILMGTMWPVFSKLWSSNPVGLEAKFYNKVCLPLFALLALLLTVCPWLGWKDGLRDKKKFLAVLGVFFGFCAALFAAGIRMPVALMGAAGGLAAAAGIVLLFATDTGVRKLRASWGAYGVHFGLALAVLGVAVSGPYMTEAEAVLKPGESVQLEEYTFTYKDMREGHSPAMAYIEAELEVSRDGKAIGTLLPQRRLYRKFEQPYAEAGVLPGLGDELYATLLSSRADKTATLKVSVHPLINWIWIGSTLMCLFPVLGFKRYGRKRAGDA